MADEIDIGDLIDSFKGKYNRRDEQLSLFDSPYSAMVGVDGYSPTPKDVEIALKALKELMGN